MEIIKWCSSLNTTIALLSGKFSSPACYTAGYPTPGPRTSTGPRPVRNQAAQQEGSSGRASKASSAALHRSPLLALLPEPSPPHLPSVEKLSSTKLVPGAKKVGDRCCTRHLYQITSDCVWKLINE